MAKEWKDLEPNDLYEIYLNKGMPGLQEVFPLHINVAMGLSAAILKLIPSDPRCYWCKAPFKGGAAGLMKAIGKGQSRENPNVCKNCEHFFHKHTTGAEVHVAIMFADIRGSTGIAETMSPFDFSQLISKFFTVSTNELIKQKGTIDKLIGDEVTAFFVPGISGKTYLQNSINAARGILKNTGHNDPEGPWAPIGIGIHSGIAYVGIVGHPDGITEITVLGDVANTASRLASKAKAGEIIISNDIAMDIGINTSQLENRSLSLKGKSDLFDTWVL